MRREFVMIDVFTERRFGGNPLAVLPDATGLDAAQMQSIANEFNLSETSFILPAEEPGHAARVRIFTPATELPFAGHPTVGAAYVIASRMADLPDGDSELILEEDVGPVPVRVTRAGGRVVNCELTAAQRPEWGPEADPAALAAVLGLEAADIGVGPLGSRGLSCGFPFLYAPLRDCDAVRRARLDTAAWDRHLAGGWAENVYLFAFGGQGQDVDIHARMFGRGVGVDEDPATGSAAVGLAAYLSAGADDGTHRWCVEQGVEMGRPSRLAIEAEVRGGEVVATRVGGACVDVSEGTIRVG